MLHDHSRLCLPRLERFVKETLRQSLNGILMNDLGFIRQKSEHIECQREQDISKAQRGASKREATGGSG